MLSQLILPLCFIVPIIYFKYALNGDISKEHSSLVEGLRLSSKAARIFNAVSLLKLMISIVILVFLWEYPGIEIPCLIYLSLLTQIYILWVWPFEERKDTLVALFNEACSTFYLYTTILLSDFADGTTIKLQASSAIIAIYTISASVNFIMVFISMAKEARRCSKVGLC